MDQIFPTLRFEPYDLVNGRERYLNCYRDTWQIAHGSLEGFDANAAWETATLRGRESKDNVLAAYVEDRFAGVLAMDDRRGRFTGRGWIAFFYLLPEFRGQGLGRQLMEEAARHYRAIGRKVLRLTVARDYPAVGFYRKTGFRHTGWEPGALEDLMVMERKL